MAGKGARPSSWASLSSPQGGNPPAKGGCKNRLYKYVEAAAGAEEIVLKYFGYRRDAKGKLRTVKKRKSTVSQNSDMSADHIMTFDHILKEDLKYMLGGPAVFPRDKRLPPVGEDGETVSSGDPVFYQFPNARGSPRNCSYGGSIPPFRPSFINEEGSTTNPSVTRGRVSRRMSRRDSGLGFASRRESFLLDGGNGGYGGNGGHEDEQKPDFVGGLVIQAQKHYYGSGEKEIPAQKHSSSSGEKEIPAQHHYYGGENEQHYYGGDKFTVEKPTYGRDKNLDEVTRNAIAPHNVYSSTLFVPDDSNPINLGAGSLAHQPNPSSDSHRVQRVEEPASPYGFLNSSAEFESSPIIKPKANFVPLPADFSALDELPRTGSGDTIIEDNMVVTQPAPAGGKKTKGNGILFGTQRTLSSSELELLKSGLQ